VRSEFHEFMSASVWWRRSRRSKGKFDPNGVLNPGKIVHAPKFDDPHEIRYGPNYAAPEIKTQLDWSPTRAPARFPGRGRDVHNNGACRKSTGGVMCPSYRVTRDERDVTRGAPIRCGFAITGQLGGDALTSDEMAETMKLLRLVQGLPSDMPTGVDMARLKIECRPRAPQSMGFRCATGWSAGCPR